MKKRSALIGAILALMQIGQTAIIKNSIFLTTTGLPVSFPNNVYADNLSNYLQLGRVGRCW